MPRRKGEQRGVWDVKRTMRALRPALPYAGLLLCVTVMSVLTRELPAVRGWFGRGEAAIPLVVAIIFLLGYWTNRLAPKTAIPSFVWAIFFGMALEPALSVLTHDLGAIRVVVELLAALVLFGGGVEVPIGTFKKWFAPIAALAVVGVLFTSFAFASTLALAAPLLGFSVPVVAAVLLGAILASTDPTAIIPSLKKLRFVRPFLKDVAVSESAVNDVSGTILTRFLLVLVASAGAAGAGTVAGWYAPILRKATLEAFALEALYGVFIGLIGAWMLKRWSAKAAKEGSHTDPALFLSVPILMYALGGIIGGSGFLAAFVAGLLFEADKPTREVREFFERTVDGFVKPVIFILLGALVPLPLLLASAPLGILAAALFMGVIRPLAVFITLLPWTFGRGGFRLADLLFLSFVRETGVIPAVLLVVTAATGVVASDQLVALGMWVILLTLVVEPPLTPWVAKKLGVAK